MNTIQARPAPLAQNQMKLEQAQFELGLKADQLQLQAEANMVQMEADVTVMIAKGDMALAESQMNAYKGPFPAVMGGLLTGIGLMTGVEGGGVHLAGKFVHGKYLALGGAALLAAHGANHLVQNAENLSDTTKKVVNRSVTGAAITVTAPVLATLLQDMRVSASSSGLASGMSSVLVLGSAMQAETQSEALAYTAVGGVGGAAITTLATLAGKKLAVAPLIATGATLALGTAIALSKDN